MAELFSSPIPISAAQEPKVAAVAGEFLEWYRMEHDGAFPPGWDDADPAVQLQAKIDLIETKLIDVIRRVYKAAHRRQYEDSYAGDQF
jgi:hypothetical protein